MQMSDDARHYQSYLLRLWRAGGGPPNRWRISLEDTRSGLRQAFTSLDELIAFIDQGGDGPTTPARDLPGEEEVEGQRER